MVCWVGGSVLVGWAGRWVLASVGESSKSLHFHQQGVQPARDTQQTGCKSAVGWLFANCVGGYVGRSSLECFDVVCLIRRQLLKVVGVWSLLVCVPMLAVGCPSVCAEVSVSPVVQAASAAMLASSAAIQAASEAHLNTLVLHAA